MTNHLMKRRKCGEAEKCVGYVCGKFEILLPVFTQCSGECAEESFQMITKTGFKKSTYHYAAFLPNYPDFSLIAKLAPSLELSRPHLRRAFQCIPDKSFVSPIITYIKFIHARPLSSHRSRTRRRHLRVDHRVGGRSDRAVRLPLLQIVDELLDLRVLARLD